MGRGIGRGCCSGIGWWFVVMMISLDISLDFSRMWTFEPREPVKMVSGAIEPLPKQPMVAY